MKKTLLLLCALSFYNGKAQTLQFTYDNAGNQIKRELVTLQVNSLMQPMNVETPDILDDEIISIKEAAIEYFPNPVVDLLNIHWDSSLNIVQIGLYDNKGKLLQVKKTSSAENSTILDLSNYSSGLYMLVVFNDKKENKTYKIIKH